MDASALIASLQEALPGVEATAVPGVDRHQTIDVPRERLLPVARALRDRPDLAFDLLADLTACDFWPREPRFELIYVLVSTSRLHRVRMKVRVRGDDARVADVSGVWPAANWLEREVWDLFGVVFEGHPDLRRLLMPEDWDGHPLRKDYPVQIKMVPRTSEPLQMTEQEFRANIEKDRERRK